MSTTKKPIIRVAVIGPAGAGKSTLCRALQKEFGGGDVLSFATPLKKVASDIFGERLDDPTLCRQVLQDLGHWARTIDQNVWVEKLLGKVSETRNCFVDDCRYPNECQALTSRGFVVVRLAAMPQTLRERRPHMTDAQRQHATEVGQEVLTPDLTISSELPLETIVQTVVEFLDRR